MDASASSQRVVPGPADGGPPLPAMVQERAKAYLAGLVSSEEPWTNATVLGALRTCMELLMVQGSHSDPSVSSRVSELSSHLSLPLDALVAVCTAVLANATATWRDEDLAKHFQRSLHGFLESKKLTTSSTLKPSTSASRPGRLAASPAATSPPPAPAQESAPSAPAPLASKDSDLRVTTLFIAGIPLKSDVGNICVEAAKCKPIRIQKLNLRGRPTKTSRALVRFSSRDVAQEALAKLNDFEAAPGLRIRAEWSFRELLVKPRPAAHAARVKGHHPPRDSLSSATATAGPSQQSSTVPKSSSPLSPRTPTRTPHLHPQQCVEQGLQRPIMKQPLHPPMTSSPHSPRAWRLQ